MTTVSPDALPHSREAEQAVLGSLLMSPTLVNELTGKITAEDFHVGAHRDIFDTLMALADAAAPTDETALAVALANVGLLDRLPGGAGYLTLLADKAAPSHVHYYVGVLGEQRQKRSLMSFYVDGLQRLREPSGLDAGSLVGQAQSVLDDISDQRQTNETIRVDDSLTATMELMEELGQRDGSITGIPTGFTDFDEHTSGLHPGQMITIAARPGLGKSTLGLNWAQSAALVHHRTTVIFSLEMSHQEIMMRLLSAEARVPLNHLRSGKLSEAEWNAISRKCATIADAPLFIDDNSSITMSEIRAKARRIKARYGLDLIIIDYLQLMQGDGRANSRQEEVSQMSRACKLLAKELGCVVVVMSQLNRGSEQRADKKPQVSDLRESGSIEQDSDMVLLIYREDLYDPDSPRAGEADLIIGKYRQGACVTLPVAFQGHLSRFKDMGSAFAA